MSVAGPMDSRIWFQNIKPIAAKQIVASYIKAGILSSYFMTETEGTFTKVGKRIIGQLPTPTSVNVGQEPAIPFVVPNVTYDESCALWRDNFDFDKMYKSDPNYIAGWLEMQQQAYTDAYVYNFNNYLINNDEATGPIADAKGFPGIRTRLINYSQFGLTQDTTVSDPSLSLATGDLGSTNAVRITRLMDLLMDRMGVRGDEMKDVLFIASPQFIRQFAAVMKYAGGNGGFRITTDLFDRTIAEYRGAQIVSCGYLAPDANNRQVTPVIADAQDINGYQSGDSSFNSTGAVYTTVYAVRRGKNHFHLWEHSSPTVITEPIPGTRLIRMMLDHTGGIWQPDTRALGRIPGIKTDGSNYS